MSFFGFDPTGPPGNSHQSRAPGFASAPDRFAGLSQQQEAAEDDALDFEDEYDGLGDGLDETDDAFNDDTFADEPATQQGVGRDFDFHGQTAIRSDVKPQQPRIQHTQQTVVSSRSYGVAAAPARTGYEKYSEPGYIPSLEANANLWGIKPKQQAAPLPSIPQQTPSPANAGNVPAASRKMMSLEEVEAAMRGQPKHPSPAPPSQRPTSDVAQPPHQSAYQVPSQPPGMSGYDLHPDELAQRMQHAGPQYPGPPPQILQRLQQEYQDNRVPPQQGRFELPMHGGPPGPALLQSHQIPEEPAAQLVSRPGPNQYGTGAGHGSQPRQVLQNPNRLSGQGQPMMPPPNHARHTSVQGSMIYTPEQLMRMSEGDRELIMQEQAKREKRNQKIQSLSKNNGLMTPQDKNFITRIQLQSLVTATGNTDQDPNRAENEDWYYNVMTLVRNMQRSVNQAPQNNQFAQTYLTQTGGRYGSAGRRHPRHGDNHVQRMEQQVQRAVEAARAKPKNKQLVIEGSLGKISFSNSKTPKPLLNLKRNDSNDGRPSSSASNRNKVGHTSVSDLKDALRNIEAAYLTLMELEDHQRRAPSQPPDANDDPEIIQQFIEWQQRLKQLSDRLWSELNTGAPIVDDPNKTHPFIAILSQGKGKKAIPRIFAQVDDEQRLIIITLIAVHINTVDVVRNGAISSGDESKPSSNAEQVELFGQAVLPSLFFYINEAPLPIVTGLSGVLRDRANFPHLLRTKMGTRLLTILISRSELLRKGQSDEQLRDDSGWSDWGQLFDAIFDRAEPILASMFPQPTSQSTASVDADDVHVWEFLAALGAAASPDQQQRLVMAVKDHVMQAVTEAKLRPGEHAQRRLGKANLFLRAIGLDAELLA